MGGQQTPVPTFRLAVEYIEVDARVEDADGRPIRGLALEDFRLLEDGIEQAVTNLIPVDLPIVDTTAAPPPPVAPRFVSDVATNTHTEGRLFVILLDDRHIDAVRTNKVRTLVKTFIETSLGPDDVAAVIATSGRRDLSQDFTSDKARLMRAVDGFVGRKLPSPTVLSLSRTDPFADARRRGSQRAAPSDQFAPERRLEARLAIASLRSTATWMAGIQGRQKGLVLVTEGLDYNTEDIANDQMADQLLDDMEEATAVATRANVAIYPVDPRGLDSAFDELMQVGGTTGPSAGLIRALEGEKQRSHIGMRTLAAETGGIATLNTNDFAAGFADIIERSSTYYILGYYPTNPRREGRFRNIDVRVTRPEARVTYRRGYTENREASDTATPPAGPQNLSVRVREALNTPLASSAVPLSMTAVALRGPDANPTVTVIAETGADLVRGDSRETPIELTVVAVDQNAMVVASRSSSMTLRDETLDRVKAHGFRLISRLSLKPGRYQVRVVAGEGERSTAGAVWYDLEVPNFRGEDFTMSGVLLARAASMAVVADPTNLLVSGMLPLAPTTQRTFSPADELIGFAEIYDNRLEPRHDVELTILIESAAGRQMLRHTETRTEQDVQALKGTVGVTTRVPLSDFAPGRYVLTLEARRRGDRPQTVSRHVPFEVQ